MWPPIGMSGALHRVLSGPLCTAILSMAFQRYVVSPVSPHELRHVEVLVCGRAIFEAQAKTSLRLKQ